MPRATPYVFETTVFEPTQGTEASLISVPAAVLQRTVPESSYLLSAPADLADQLGVRLGVQLQSPADLPDVFFASLAGRVAPFDQFSAERWRTQRLERSSTPEAQFAVELATMEFVAVEESPLSGTSLTSLATRGVSYTIGGWDAISGHPFMGLGVLVIGQFGFVIAQVVRAFGDEAYIITRYHARRLRRVFHVPEDWNP
jgi:hypothetical protein